MASLPILIQMLQLDIQDGSLNSIQSRIASDDSVVICSCSSIIFESILVDIYCPRSSASERSIDFSL